MVVDTSALIAILNREPERESLLLALEEAGRCCISALSLYETKLVVLARPIGEQGVAEMEELIGEFGFSVAIRPAKADLPLPRIAALERASARRHPSIYAIARPTPWLNL